MRTNRFDRKPRRLGQSQSGFTLMEVMIALSVGLILMVGLVSSFVGASRSQRAMQSDSEQIENGRQAIDMLTQDIKMAGHYKTYYLIPSSSGVPQVPTSLPDPCATAVADLQTSLMLHVQPYYANTAGSAPDLSAAGASTSCGGLLASSNLAPDSDVLVIRRAATIELGSAADLVADQIYLQDGVNDAKIQKGVSPAAFNKTWGAATSDNQDVTSATNPNLLLRSKAGLVVAGPIQRFITRIYFVAPCTRGTGTGGACQATDDKTPTLKMLELTVPNAGETGCYKPTAGVNTAFCLRSLVEGIQAIAFDSGIDASPNTASVATGFIGDGVPDSYTRSSTSMTDMADTVAMNIFVLARNTAKDTSYTDTKYYSMTDNSRTSATKNLCYSSMTTPITCTPSSTGNENYKKHIYTARARIENISNRRENP